MLRVRANRSTPIQWRLSIYRSLLRFSSTLSLDTSFCLPDSPLVFPTIPLCHSLAVPLVSSTVLLLEEIVRVESSGRLEPTSGFISPIFPSLRPGVVSPLLPRIVTPIDIPVIPPVAAPLLLLLRLVLRLRGRRTVALRGFLSKTVSTVLIRRLRTFWPAFWPLLNNIYIVVHLHHILL